MRSLRRRLLTGTIFVVATILAVAAVLIYLNVESFLIHRFQMVLLERARALSAMTEQRTDGIELDFADTDFKEFSRVNAPDYFQLWLPDGSVLERSKSLGDRHLKRQSSKPNLPVFQKVSLPDARNGRQVSLRFFPKIADEIRGGVDSKDDHRKDGGAALAERIDSTVTVVVAASTSEVDSMLSKLIALLGTVCLAGLLVAVGLTLFVVRQSLIPLKRVALQIELFDERSLDKKIDVGEAPEELVPVVHRVNDLLGRIETVFRREQAFSSEVAHELRTPLAGLLSSIEVCLRQPRHVEKYQDTLRKCRTICQQCETMVESLLEIAQLEQGNVPVTLENVDLSALLSECWELLMPHATQKQLQVSWSEQTPIHVTSDADKLRVVIRNLMQNAVSYCDNSGEIRVTTSATKDSVQLSIENTGNEILPDEVDGIFGRFWRGDHARAETGRHFGLGLSLVQKLLVVLRGTIAISVSYNRFRVDLALPQQFNGIPITVSNQENCG